MFTIIYKRLRLKSKMNKNKNNPNVWNKNVKNHQNSSNNNKNIQPTTPQTNPSLIIKSYKNKNIDKDDTIAQANSEVSTTNSLISKYAN